MRPRRAEPHATPAQHARSARDLLIVAALAGGLSSRVVARLFGLSKGTVGRAREKWGTPGNLSPAG
jgi:transposase